jgi:hypothetical protein
VGILRFFLRMRYFPLWAKPGFDITTSPEGDREREKERKRERDKGVLVLLLYNGVYRTGGGVLGSPDQSPSPY